MFKKAIYKVRNVWYQITKRRTYWITKSYAEAGVEGFMEGSGYAAWIWIIAIYLYLVITGRKISFVKK